MWSLVQPLRQLPNGSSCSHDCVWGQLLQYEAWAEYDDKRILFTYLHARFALVFATLVRPLLILNSKNLHVGCVVIVALCRRGGHHSKYHSHPLHVCDLMKTWEWARSAGPEPKTRSGAGKIVSRVSTSCWRHFLWASSEPWVRLHWCSLVLTQAVWHVLFKPQTHP